MQKIIWIIICILNFSIYICRTSAHELAPAVSILQLFCSSPKPTLRFAAVRTLNKVYMYKCFLSEISINFCKNKNLTASILIGCNDPSSCCYSL